MTHAGVTIITPARLSPAQHAAIDCIFLDAAGRTFADDGERAAFRARWLGRYLGGDDVVLLAVAQGDRVAGYLVGALHNPATQMRFDDIAYYRADFADLCARWPAHLHINLAPEFRAAGIGARLIDAFAERAAAAGAGGVHVVTASDARNVRFYQRCGFVERGRTMWNGRPLSFLGRDL